MKIIETINRFFKKDSNPIENNIDSNSNIEESVDPAPKKRGRPKKVLPLDYVKPAPKKRGRPKKVLPLDYVKPAPKKRGRPRIHPLPPDYVKPAERKRKEPLNKICKIKNNQSLVLNKNQKYDHIKYKSPVQPRYFKYKNNEYPFHIEIVPEESKISVIMPRYIYDRIMYMCDNHIIEFTNTDLSTYNNNTKKIHHKEILRGQAYKLLMSIIIGQAPSEGNDCIMTNLPMDEITWLTSKHNDAKITKFLLLSKLLIRNNRSFTYNKSGYYTSIAGTYGVSQYLTKLPKWKADHKNYNIPEEDYEYSDTIFDPYILEKNIRTEEERNYKYLELYIRDKEEFDNDMYVKTEFDFMNNKVINYMYESGLETSDYKTYNFVDFEFPKGIDFIKIINKTYNTNSVKLLEMLNPDEDLEDVKKRDRKTYLSTSGKCFTLYNDLIKNAYNQCLEKDPNFINNVIFPSKRKAVKLINIEDLTKPKRGRGRPKGSKNLNSNIVPVFHENKNNDQTDINQNQTENTAFSLPVKINFKQDENDTRSIHSAMTQESARTLQLMKDACKNNNIDITPKRKSGPCHKIKLTPELVEYSSKNGIDIYKNLLQTGKRVLRKSVETSNESLLNDMIYMAFMQKYVKILSDKNHQYNPIYVAEFYHELKNVEKFTSFYIDPYYHPNLEDIEFAAHRAKWLRIKVPSITDVFLDHIACNDPEKIKFLVGNKTYLKTGGYSLLDFIFKYTGEIYHAALPMYDVYRAQRTTWRPNMREKDYLDQKKDLKNTFNINYTYLKFDPEILNEKNNYLTQDLFKSICDITMKPSEHNKNRGWCPFCCLKKEWRPFLWLDGAPLIELVDLKNGEWRSLLVETITDTYYSDPKLFKGCLPDQLQFDHYLDYIKGKDVYALICSDEHKVGIEEPYRSKIDRNAVKGQIARLFGSTSLKAFIARGVRKATLNGKSRSEISLIEYTCRTMAHWCENSPAEPLVKALHKMNSIYNGHDRNKKKLEKEIEKQKKEEKQNCKDGNIVYSDSLKNKMNKLKIMNKLKSPTKIYQDVESNLMDHVCSTIYYVFKTPVVRLYDAIYTSAAYQFALYPWKKAYFNCCNYWYIGKDGLIKNRIDYKNSKYTWSFIGISSFLYKKLYIKDLILDDCSNIGNDTMYVCHDESEEPVQNNLKKFLQDTYGEHWEEWIPIYEMKFANMRHQRGKKLKSSLVGIKKVDKHYKMKYNNEHPEFTLTIGERKKFDVLLNEMKDEFIQKYIKNAKVKETTWLDTWTTNMVVDILKNSQFDYRNDELFNNVRVHNRGSLDFKYETIITDLHEDMENYINKYSKKRYMKKYYSNIA